MTRSDPYQMRARELCKAAGLDPDARVGEGRGMPQWCAFKQAAQDEQYGPQLLARKEPERFSMLIEADNDAEYANVQKVKQTFAELMLTPNIKAGAVMPDACPAGPLGAIPVGGVVSSTDIHPGFHSADICCSMAISILDNVDPKLILDAGMAVSHFGAGGREPHTDMVMSAALATAMDANPFLSSTLKTAQQHFGTQGDGNHFFYVGHLKSTGQVALVTHHGSRAPGASLYKIGMEAAERYRKKIAPDTLPQNAWIPSGTIDGENYWAALQLIRQWTKENHFTIHDAVAKYVGVKVRGRFWNEHNFVFQKADGLFYHGKGATPAWKGFAADATDLTIIPLNMAQPILIVKGKDNPEALGFSPHGAGRNLSRTGHFKSLGEHDPAEVLSRETQGLDVRFFAGKPDLSELPSAYKNAQSVRAQIDKFGLAELVDEVIPYGTIMAGDIQSEWRERRAAKKALAKNTAPE